MNTKRLVPYRESPDINLSADLWEYKSRVTGNTNNVPDNNTKKSIIYERRGKLASSK